MALIGYDSQLISHLKCRKSRCFPWVMITDQLLENVKRLEQMRNWSFLPYFTVHLVLRCALAATIMMLAIAKIVRLLPLQKFHRDVTRHHPSLSGRHSSLHARKIDPLPGVGLATLAALRSPSLSARSFPWGRRSAPSCDSGWASHIFDSWAVCTRSVARVCAWISGQRRAPDQYWCGSCQLSTGATRSPPSGLAGGWPNFRLNCPYQCHFSAKPWCTPQCNVLRDRWR